MALMGKSRSISIVHPGCEENPAFNAGDGHVELATSRGNEFYVFDRVFPAKTPQEKVFQEVARAPVLDALESFVSTVFLAFGPTGSGKTFAITGGAKRFADRGLIPRSISALFEALGARSDREEFEVAVSFYEVYKEAVVDLLSEKRRRVPVQQVEGQGTVLQGLLRQTAATESDAYHLLFQGDSNRHFERFPANPETSRGHVFYVLHLMHIPSGREATLSFIDLASVITTRNHATLAIERSLDAFQAATAAVCAGDQPIFDDQILTQLLRPLLHPDQDMMAPHLAILCPLRYTAETARETQQWLDFARQLREAFATANSCTTMEEEAVHENEPQLYIHDLPHINQEAEHNYILAQGPTILESPFNDPTPPERIFEEEAPAQNPTAYPQIGFGDLDANYLASPLSCPAAEAPLYQEPQLHWQVRDHHPYQPPPIAEAQQVNEGMGQHVWDCMSSPSPSLGPQGTPSLQPSPCTWQSPSKVVEYGPGMAMRNPSPCLSAMPLVETSNVFLQPSVSTWTPPHRRIDGRSDDVMADSLRMSSDVTAPPQAQVAYASDSPTSAAMGGSVTLGQNLNYITTAD